MVTTPTQSQRVNAVIIAIARMCSLHVYWGFSMSSKLNMEKFETTQKNLTELASTVSSMATEYAWTQCYIHLMETHYPETHKLIAPLIDRAFEDNEKTKQTG
tara:strand:+ start:503 stop:808 length:306 start_codon:yes stop_codon:yes gene_type:complete